MKFCLITFRSVTPAQRAEAVLHREGMECTIQRTPRWMAEQGCGYSLRVRLADAYSAADLLRRKEVSFRKIYVPLEGGTYEEISV